MPLKSALKNLPLKNRGPAACARASPEERSSAQFLARL
jgi:hypothetical protein